MSVFGGVRSALSDEALATALMLQARKVHDWGLAVPAVDGDQSGGFEIG